MNNELPKRKNIRLKNYDYSLPGTYFVTICTQARKNYFWNDQPDLKKIKWDVVGANCVRPQNLPLSRIGEIVREELEKMGISYSTLSLYSYVIMPNHIHLLIRILSDENGRPQVAPTVSRIIKQFKGVVTKRVGEVIWQKSFMEHIVRDKQDYEARVNYIYKNPERWYYDELCSKENMS